MCSLHNRSHLEDHVAPAPDGPGPGLALLAKRRAEIAALCRLYGVDRLAVFGPALEADFDPTTREIDLVVDFSDVPSISPARQTVDFKAGLEALLGRSVGIVDLDSMADSRLKRIIERTQRLLYSRTA